MERRYGREAVKYRTKIKPGKKSSYEKLILRQSGFCAVILAAGIAVSYINIGSANVSRIKNVLYTTTTLAEWKAIAVPAVKSVKNNGKKLVSAFNDSVESAAEKLGFDTKKTAAPIAAKADEKNKKTEEKKEEASPPAPQEENVPPEEELVFKVPTTGDITSAFGSRVHPINQNTLPHTGIDIGAPAGQTVIAAAPGQVTAVGYDDANGHYVVVKHNDGIETVYAHLLKASVIQNEVVDDNTKIGEVGSSGVSTGPHLHFEIKVNKESVNPENYISLPHRNGV